MTPGLDARQFYVVNMVNNADAMRELYEQGDMASKPAGSADIPFVVVGSNRGDVRGLLRNAAHAGALYALGLRQDTAVACIFHYLFRPNADTLALGEPYFQRLADPRMLTVGVHIRMGDDHFMHDALTEHSTYSTGVSVRGFFECAEQVIDQLKHARPQSVIYLVSDSMALKRQAKREYGDRIITDLDNESMHVDYVRCLETNTTCDGRHMARSIQLAAVQMLAFAMTDIHIVSEWSGFGRWASMLTTQPTLRFIPRRGPAGVQCAIANAATPADIMKLGAGM